jgi:hypothetical protein
VVFRYPEDGELASEYGFTDVDGRQWPPFQIEA